MKEGTDEAIVYTAFPDETIKHDVPFYKKEADTNGSRLQAILFFPQKFDIGFYRSYVI